MTPKKIIAAHNVLLDEAKNLLVSHLNYNYRENTDINATIAIAENSIAIFQALEKAGYQSGIIHESCEGKIVISSLGIIESEGDLGEDAIVDFLNWESQVIENRDANVAETLLRWAWDEDEASEFPERVGFTKVGFNYMKLI